MNINQVIASTIDLILATRDFCGDERAALRDAQDDFGRRFTESEKRAIADGVRRGWSQSQADAGVTNPLTDSERAKAYADVENVEDRP